MNRKAPLQPNVKSVELDSSTDREQGLADKFEDPSLDEIVPGISAGDPSYGASVVQEAADAVHDLVNEIHQSHESSVAEEFVIEKGPDAEVFQVGGPDEVPPFDISNVVVGDDMKIEKDVYVNPVNFQIEEEASETALVAARWQMAQKIFELVACELPFVKLVDGILLALVSGLDANAGSVLELDHERNEYFFRSSHGGGDQDRLKSFRVPASTGIVGHVAETGEVVLLKDLDDDAKHLKAISMSTGFETKTCLAGPIVISNKIFGVVELFNKKGNSYFSASDSLLFQDGIKMAAKALEVRFLMAEVYRRVK